MLNSVSSLNSGLSGTGNLFSKAKSDSKESNSSSSAADILQLGKGGSVSNTQAMNMVVERALDKIRSVVTEARQQLGLSDNDVLDTSPEATANRIADFALSFWSTYAEKHGLEDTQDNRQQFADFIGGAINQGIGEARGILTALSALNPEVDDNINKTSNVIQSRLQDFITNGLTK